MTDKVKLPREVVEAIEHMKYMGLHNIVESVVNMGDVTTEQLMTIRNHFKSDWLQMMQALVNGYEVEREPNEVIKWQFDMWKRDINLFPERAQMYFGRREGMKDTLDILNIKIEGVNA